MWQGQQGIPEQGADGGAIECTLQQDSSADRKEIAHTKAKTSQWHKCKIQPNTGEAAGQAMLVRWQEEFTANCELIFRFSQPWTCTDKDSAKANTCSYTCPLWRCSMSRACTRDWQASDVITTGQWFHALLHLSSQKLYKRHARTMPSCLCKKKNIIIFPQHKTRHSLATCLRKHCWTAGSPCLPSQQQWEQMDARYLGHISEDRKKNGTTANKKNSE